MKTISSPTENNILSASLSDFVNNIYTYPFYFFCLLTVACAIGLFWYKNRGWINDADGFENAYRVIPPTIGIDLSIKMLVFDICKYPELQFVLLVGAMCTALLSIKNITKHMNYRKKDSEKS